MHLAIIPDGNRRHGGLKGHYDGVAVLIRIVAWCMENDLIDELSVYVFSEENWGRPNVEIETLMNIVKDYILELEMLARGEYPPTLQAIESKIGNSESARTPIFDALIDYLNARKEKCGVESVEEIPSSIFNRHPFRLKICSTSTSQFSSDIKDIISRINKLYDEMSMFTDFYPKRLNICLSYGGKQDVLQAVNLAISSFSESSTSSLLELPPPHLNLNDIESRLLISSPPDLIIRTSGEQRLSNFMGWQSSYSEFDFVDKLWPDVTPSDISTSLANFASRMRRCGK